MAKRTLIFAAVLLMAIVATAGVSLINLTSQVTGILPVANGGTGQSSALVPAGMITFINSGTCPTGWTEVNLGANYLLATVAANGDVGTTGGSNGTSSVSGGTPAGTNSATATTGNCSSTVKVGTSSSSACSATAPNLTVPAETFTGSALAPHSHTIQPSYVKLIPCQKN